MAEFQPIFISEEGTSLPYKEGQFIFAEKSFSDGAGTTYAAGVYVDAENVRNWVTRQGAPGKDGTDGTDGTDGVGISSVDSINHSIVGDETVTACRVEYDGDKQPTDFYVYAENGANGETGKDALYYGDFFLYGLEPAKNINVYGELSKFNRTPELNETLPIFINQIGKVWAAYAQVTEINTTHAKLTVTDLYRITGTNGTDGAPAVQAGNFIILPDVPVKNNNILIYKSNFSVPPTLFKPFIAVGKYTPDSDYDYYMLNLTMIMEDSRQYTCSINDVVKINDKRDVTLYIHDVHFKHSPGAAPPANVFLRILSPSLDAINSYEALKFYLQDNGFNSSSRIHIVNGFTSSPTTVAIGLYYDAINDSIYSVSISGGSTKLQYESETADVVTDKITTLNL